MISLIEVKNKFSEIDEELVTSKCTSNRKPGISAQRDWHGDPFSMSLSIQENRGVRRQWHTPIRLKPGLVLWGTAPKT